MRGRQPDRKERQLVGFRRRRHLAGQVEAINCAGEHLGATGARVGACGPDENVAPERGIDLKGSSRRGGEPLQPRALFFSGLTLSKRALTDMLPDARQLAPALRICANEMPLQSLQSGLDIASMSATNFVPSTSRRCHTAK
ncbi:hypothetical protein [Duganella sp. Leaf126]|uniref:hypothetical protein n=1 Tax=Duganella sp. Leaf126 TaxID=1736266 RepID=UPI0012E2770C|nr:hypothetical protein [Duganella sp. Leaf126]